MRYNFMILDVFTDRPFGGNQLAVLTDARGISADGMQAIAREFNFPETTFVLPPDDPANVRRVRIFTPGGELPFAGHPTVGTACALAIAGKVPVGDAVLEEGVGPVAVTTWHEHGAYFARLRVERGPETSDVVPTAEDVAAVLSLDPSEVLDLFCAGLGPRFTFVRVASRETVDRSQLDVAEWRRLLADTWGAQVHVFAGELKDGAEIYARMFAPAFGISEDPATGAAAAAIVGAAAARGRDGEIRLKILQGVAMGRPSLLNASAKVEGGAVFSIEVGGSCVLVAEGTIEVPGSSLDQPTG